jgi:hypothetical protein
MRLLLLFSILVALSCTKHYFRSNYKEANQLLHSTDTLKTKPFLKAHLKNGDICILTDQWRVDTVANFLNGRGQRYDFNRKKIYDGAIILAIDSVAIFETNTKLDNPEHRRISLITIMTAVEVGLGILCFSRPKACFGSCPTFYLDENDQFHYADAEGFSNAIAPSMEYNDVDALRRVRNENGQFSITMKNEALETHCVNAVNLLAFPTAPNEQVYQTGTQNFFLSDASYPLQKAMADEGDITSLLAQPDRNERFSLSDPHNLSSRETIFLEFDASEADGQLGLLLHFRQTLMTTYFIYNAMGYMGDAVGDIFAEVERRGSTTMRNLKKGLKAELGEIEVHAWNEQNQAWEPNGGLYETGPIAFNQQLVPLNISQTKGTVRLKIILNKGLWRVDYSALVRLKAPVQPLTIEPTSVLKQGQIDAAALHDLLQSNRYLVSMPGDAYQINYTLPQTQQAYDLFLDTKGYYLEWMRGHWLADKNLLKLKQMIDYPKIYLKTEAANFKRYEAQMEAEFWNSKIETNRYTSHEK